MHDSVDETEPQHSPSDQLQPDRLQPERAEQPIVSEGEPQWGSADKDAKGLHPASELVESLRERARDWLLAGNPIVKVGILLLFVGVAFFLKFAADHALLPIELRLASVAAGSMVLLALGWRLRESNPVYGLTLQGGAVGGLYLTIYAAFRLYELMPATPAFALLALVAVLAGLLAVQQNSMSLAMLGSVGGFVAPVLASTGSGSHIQLFNYFLLLNLGILGISWFKSWRPLNVLSFLLTFGIAGLWAAQSYQPDYLLSAEIYLILFSLLYLAIPVLFAFRPSQPQQGIVDGSLVFGLPTVAASLQGMLFSGSPLALAFSAACTAVLYYFLARFLMKRLGASASFMAQTFLAIALVFASLALPLALDPRTTAGLWALEGVGLLWLGTRQNQLLPRVFGYLLQLGAWLSLFPDMAGASRISLPFFNGFSIAAAMVAPAALYAAWQCKRDKLPFSTVEWLYPVLLIAAVWWWVVAWSTAVGTFEQQYAVLLLGLVTVLTIGAADWLAGRLPWPDLLYAGRALLPLCALLLLCVAGMGAHPLQTPLWIVWLLAGVVHLRVLRSNSLALPWVRLMHVSAVWLVLLIAAWEAARLVDYFAPQDLVLQAVAVGVVLTAALWAFTRHIERMPWPLSADTKLYVGTGMWPVVLVLLAIVLFTSVASHGEIMSSFYLPLLNLPDLFTVAAGIAIGAWWWREPRVAPYSSSTKAFIISVLLIAFIWINTVWLKTAVHWLGESRYLHHQFASQQVQTGLSILWSLLGLGAMYIGTRRGFRILWFGGVTLMAVVVLKLFAIDLSSSGSIARIVSFIGVGGLLLVVGYIAPIPPGGVERGEDLEQEGAVA